ncbi:peptidoglycan-binding protein [soil metagenome]
MQEKAFIELETGARLPCLFNPTEFSVRRANRWIGDSLPGRGVPDLRFAGADSGSMSLSLFFDTTHEGKAVSTYTGKLMGAMDLDPALPGSDVASGNVRPPWVKFHWGRLHSFKAAITSLALRFTYFGADGTPLRATADVELTQVAEDLAFGPQNPTSGTPEPHKVHRVSPGETLDRIAATHYGDATRWRSIADANGIDDPLAISPGQFLAIPRTTWSPGEVGA